MFHYSTTVPNPEIVDILQTGYYVKCEEIMPNGV